MTHIVATAIATAVTAWRNCEASGNDWRHKWDERLTAIEREVLPSGSGFDSGTTIDRDKTTDRAIVLNTSFHHMNDVGMYDGWTEHKVTIRPTFNGLDISVTGRNRNDIKDYIAQVIHNVMRGNHEF